MKTRDVKAVKRIAKEYFRINDIGDPWHLMFPINQVGDGSIEVVDVVFTIKVLR